MKNIRLHAKAKFILIASLLLLAISFNMLRDFKESNDSAFDFSGLNLAFVPNHGQSEASVRYQVRGLRGDLYFKLRNLVFALPNSDGSGFSAVQQDFLGSNETVSLSPLESLPGKFNYFRGSSAESWLSNLPSYSGIVYENLYDGIDLHYFGTEGLLKNEFTVAAGANPHQIRWQYTAARNVWVNVVSGDLMIELLSGDILREKSPIAWQDIEGERFFVDLAFIVSEDKIVSFDIGEYDANYPLILDPVLEYSSYVGGSGVEYLEAIAADDVGNLYVVGRTESANFPVSVGAYSETLQGNSDIFVMKIDTTASGINSLIWSSYLGGTAADAGKDIDIDDDGNIYIVGTTGHESIITFPITGNAYSSSNDCCAIAGFLMMLDSNGSTILYSTFLGKSEPTGVSADSNGNAYITGAPTSASFPITANAYQPTAGTTARMFISKIDTTLSGTASLVYSSYIDGNDAERAVEIASDDAGNAYITGYTESTNFPVTASAYQSSLKTISNGDGMDAFVLRIDTTQSGTASLAYSTYFGGQTNSTGLAGVENFNQDTGSITTDGTGDVYITGETNSVDLPIVNGYQTSYRGGFMDSFIARIDTNQSGTASLVYSSYLGGNGFDQGYGVAVDSFGNAYITGVTTSTNFPVLNGLSTSAGGFASRINTNATGNASLLSSTRLSGTNANGYGGNAVNSFGTVYVAGQINDSSLAIRDGFQTSYRGNVDGYIIRMSHYSDLQLVRTEAAAIIPVNEPFSYTLTVSNISGDYATSILLDESFTGNMTLDSVSTSQGSCIPSTMSYSCNLANIPLNGSATITVMITPTSTGTIGKSATVDGVEIDNNAGNNISNSNTESVNFVDIGVTGNDSPDPVVASQELSYSFTISNHGSFDATNLVFTATLPAAMNYVSASPSQGAACNLVGLVLSCNLGTISPSNTATVEIVIVPTTAGTINTTASIDSLEIDLIAANNTVAFSSTVLLPPPNAPTLISPANAATIASLLPTFSWNKPAGTVRFELQLDTSNAFTSTAINLTPVSYVPTGALLTTTYYWRVRGFNSMNVPSAWSSVYTVTIVSPVNSAPLLNFHTSDTPSLTWNSVSWASQYEIQVDNSVRFTTPLEFSISVPSSQLSVVTNPLEEGTHYWRVRAINGATLGAWSTPQSFLVDLP